MAMNYTPNVYNPIKPTPVNYPPGTRVSDTPRVGTNFTPQYNNSSYVPQNPWTNPMADYNPSGSYVNGYNPYITPPSQQNNGGWRSLPGGINYGQLPWFNYLQGQSDLPYWRGPQGMPVPSTQMWNQLSPSEQGMYQGMLETQGVYMPDFQNKMNRLAPSWGGTLPQMQWSR